MALTKVRLGGLEPQYVGRRNIVINGAMNVAQRASSTTTGVNAGYHTLDRFFTSGNSAIGQYTISQSTDAPNGFSNSYKIDVTTADTSLAAGDHFGVSTNIEAQNLYQVGKGTSDAQPLTLSFYVKSNVQKQFVVELTDSGNSRHINFQKTVSATDTWERMIINIPADTSGSFGTGTAKGAELNFWLGAGTTYTSGSIQNTWASRTASNIMAGVANIADSTSNELFITGVQLEVGSVATPFEHRSFGDELLLCQRYFSKIDGSTNSVTPLGVAHGTNDTTSTLDLFYPIRPMRVATTVSVSNVTHLNVNTAAISASSSNVTFNNQSRESVRATITHSSGSGSTQGSRLIRFNTTDGYIHFDAEF